MKLREVSSNTYDVMEKSRCDSLVCLRNGILVVKRVLEWSGCDAIVQIIME